MNALEIRGSVTPKAAENPAVRDVSRQFEALFLNQLVGAMRKTVSKEGSLIPESNAERTYQAMLDSEYATQMAATDQVGLSRLVYDHLMAVSSGQ